MFMTKQSVIRFVQGAILFCATLLGTSVRAQGTITFAGWAGWNGTSYQELGLRFQVIIPPYGPYYDVMGITVGADNTPRNGTAFMLWARLHNPYNYVALSLESGAPFGLVAVDLADPTAPSYSLLPITFVGFRADGSTVSQTFTTPGGGANSFLTYQFGPDFASGLLSVQIDAPRWAMDNLVWIPEPSSAWLLLIGGGVLFYVRSKPLARRTNPEM
jgi:hypothetical protein